MTFLIIRYCSTEIRLAHSLSAAFTTFSFVATVDVIEFEYSLSGLVERQHFSYL